MNLVTLNPLDMSSCHLLAFFYIDSWPKMSSCILIGGLCLIYYIFFYNNKIPKPIAGVYTRPGNKYLYFWKDMHKNQYYWHACQKTEHKTWENLLNALKFNDILFVNCNNSENTYYFTKRASTNYVDKQGERVGIQMSTIHSKLVNEGGGQIPQNPVNVVYECPLKAISILSFVIF